MQSHAYSAVCERHGLRPFEKACPLLVPLIEEGWVDHPVTREVLRIYLREALAVCTPQVILLGCTHYPLIAQQVREALDELGCPAVIVDSAEATASVVASRSMRGDLSAADGTVACFATDSVEKFERLGSVFLGRPLSQVELLDLGG